MYPNLNAELARRGFTLERLANEMRERGYKKTIATLSLKLNGKCIVTINEAKVLRDIVAPELSLDVLFSDEPIY